MFNKLSEHLSHSIDRLRGIGRLTEDNIKDTLREIRIALLEADVALPTVQQFLERIRTQAVGETVIRSIRPGDALVKLVHDELQRTLGATQSEINLNAQAPIVILMAGLQGSGKTTTVAKLAHFLQKEKKKNVMVTSVDVYRPAAIQQLESLANQIQAKFFPSTESQSPADIVQAAIAKAKTQRIDVLIIDTAGRLHVDEEMMAEMREIHRLSQPTETLLVVDSMTGQDAANVAKTFNEQLELTGVVLTKTDGDARGGAALSMRLITGKPIKFIGIGEKIDALEPFHPDRIASRILGMGDIVSLVEETQKKMDHKKAEKIAKKIAKGKRFDFSDFLEQLQQMKKLGGMQSLLSKLPGGAQIPKAAAAMMDDKQLVKMEAIIYSMTTKERRFPALIDGSRKKRIATGSGTNIQEVNRLLKQFTQMQKMLKRFKGDKMAKQLKQLQQLQGKIPPELFNKLL